MSLDKDPVTSRLSLPVIVRLVMVAANTVILIGLFGPRFFVPKVGVAVIRTLFGSVALEEVAVFVVPAVAGAVELEPAEGRSGAATCEAGARG